MKKTILDFEAIAITSDSVGFASAYEFNGLFKIDLVREDCEYISMFPEEVPDRKRIHGTARQADGKIYFVPAAGSYLSIYDMEKGSISVLEIPEPEKRYSFYRPKFKFIDAIVFNGYLWCIPSTYPGILKVNLSTDEMTVYNQWIPPEGYMFRGGLNLYNDKIYIPSGNNNVVLEFDLLSEKGYTYHIGADNHGAMCMCGEKGKYWLAPRLSGSIVLWDIERNTVNEYITYPEDFDTDKIVFSKNFLYKGTAFFVPASANRVITASSDMPELNIYSEWELCGQSMIERLFESDDYYYFREKCKSTEWNRHFKISKKDNTLSNFLFIVNNSEKQKKEFFEALTDQDEIIREASFFGAEDFLNLI